MHARLRCRIRNQAAALAIVGLVGAVGVPGAGALEVSVAPDTEGETLALSSQVRTTIEEIERQMAARAEPVPGLKAPSKSPAPVDEPEPDPIEVAIETALAQVGKPYRWGATGPDSFDCSGLTGYAYRAAGIELPRVSRDQFAELPRVPVEEMRRGDLVVSGWGGRVSHIGIYLGGDQMVHAPRTGKNIEVSGLHNNVIGAVRPVG